MSKKVRKWDKVMDSSNESNNKKKSTVLVIEDNENIRRQLCNLLSKEHKVIYTEDWLNIPSFVFKTNPDVVLLDLCLPPEPDDKQCSRVHALKQDLLPRLAHQAAVRTVV